MDHAGRVGVREPPGDVTRDRNQGVERERALTGEGRGKRRSFDQLHDERGPPVHRSDAEDPDDVRVDEARRELGFPLEPRPGSGVAFVSGMQHLGSESRPSAEAGHLADGGDRTTADLGTRLQWLVDRGLCDIQRMRTLANPCS